jgi:hypothetical protein
LLLVTAPRLGSRENWAKLNLNTSLKPQLILCSLSDGTGRSTFYQRVPEEFRKSYFIQRSQQKTGKILVEPQFCPFLSWCGFGSGCPYGCAAGGEYSVEYI